MTKSEIQGLEDRMHAVSVFLGIPHLLTTWSGLMPVGYNAMNHFILGLAPDEWKDYGFDPNGDLDPWGFTGIDWLAMFRNQMPKDWLTDLIASRLPSGTMLAGTHPNGQVYSSLDRGATWTLMQRLGATDDIYAFANLGNGVILAGGGENATIYKSLDGGSTWTFKQALQSYEYVYDLVYLGNGIVLASCTDKKVYKSTNSGDSWTGTETELKMPYRFANIGGGVVFACSYMVSSAIYKSVDYGDTWADTVHLDEDKNTTDIIYLGNGILLVSGALDGAVWKSVNSGIDWAPASGFPTTPGFLVSNLCDMGDGVIIGTSMIYGQSSSHKMYKSTDYGSTWTYMQDLGTFHHINELVKISSDLAAFATGTPGEIHTFSMSGVVGSAEILGTEDYIDALFVIDDSLVPV